MKIFISYRREDSKYQADRIYNGLCEIVSPDNVFMDIDSIPLGANFRNTLKGWVDSCDILLALIGKDWIASADPATGGRRLDNPSDFVRIEISEALSRGIPVVPIILDDAPFPDVELLPDEMKELVDRQAEFIEFRTFDADVDRLIRKLGLEQDGPAEPPVSSEAAQEPKPATGDTASTLDQLFADARRDVWEGTIGSDGRIEIAPPIVYGAPNGRYLPGNGKKEWFRDFETAPEMVVIPSGSFLMGIAEDQFSHTRDKEGPQHEVTIGRPFAVSRFTITFDEWDACALDGGCARYIPSDEGWGRGMQPVINISWNDAQAYIAWLNSKVPGTPYRLLSEAEWEYMARAGITTTFIWGSEFGGGHANFFATESLEYDEEEVDRLPLKPLPVDSYQPNNFGVYNAFGNIWEWVEDCWHENYEGAPADGSTWLSGDANERVIRGGSWFSPFTAMRTFSRRSKPVSEQSNQLGFRVAKTLVL